MKRFFNGIFETDKRAKQENEENENLGYRRAIHFFESARIPNVIRGPNDCFLIDKILLNDQLERMKPKTERDIKKIIPRTSLEDLLKNPTPDCIDMLINCYSPLVYPNREIDTPSLKYPPLEINKDSTERWFVQMLHAYLNENEKYLKDNKEDAMVTMIVFNKKTEEFLGIVDYERIKKTFFNFNKRNYEDYLNKTILKLPMYFGNERRDIYIKQPQHILDFKGSYKGLSFNDIKIYFVYYVKGLSELYYKPPKEMKEIPGGPGYYQSIAEAKAEAEELNNEENFGIPGSQVMDEEEKISEEPSGMGIYGGKHERKKKTRKERSKRGRKQTTKRF
jgi:hypothetical protein